MDVEGCVSAAPEKITGCSQQDVELKVTKVTESLCPFVYYKFIGVSVQQIRHPCFFGTTCAMISPSLSLSLPLSPPSYLFLFIKSSPFVACEHTYIRSYIRRPRNTSILNYRMAQKESVFSLPPYLPPYLSPPPPPPLSLSLPISPPPPSLSLPISPCFHCCN